MMVSKRCSRFANTWPPIPTVALQKHLANRLLKRGTKRDKETCMSKPPPLPPPIIQPSLVPSPPPLPRDLTDNKAPADYLRRAFILCFVLGGIMSLGALFLVAESLSQG